MRVWRLWGDDGAGRRHRRRRLSTFHHLRRVDLFIIFLIPLFKLRVCLIARSHPSIHPLNGVGLIRTKNGVQLIWYLLLLLLCGHHHQDDRWLHITRIGQTDHDALVVVPSPSSLSARSRLQFPYSQNIIDWLTECCCCCCCAYRIVP